MTASALGYSVDNSSCFCHEPRDDATGPARRPFSSLSALLSVPQQPRYWTLVWRYQESSLSLSPSSCFSCSRASEFNG
ncbi:hypothetical protein MSG28_004987 [Choristoneura fumiferana]|uniref:Uncharacterized protein n=1 Tax=Choristoneura fumiferana TaxID=7141 RepID=A0ACC0JPB3_CHOFU|nr:hypothetical protein MSG28_004987 [Choristoneura fumiferana]